MEAKLIDEATAKKLLDRISEEINPANLAKQGVTRAQLEEKLGRMAELIRKQKGATPAAQEMLSSAYNRFVEIGKKAASRAVIDGATPLGQLTKLDELNQQGRVKIPKSDAIPQTRPNVPMSNVDALNEGRPVRVGVQTDTGRALERASTTIDPRTLKDTEMGGRMTPPRQGAVNKFVQSRAPMMGGMGKAALGGALLNLTQGENLGAALGEGALGAASMALPAVPAMALMPSEIGQDQPLSPEQEMDLQAQMRQQSDEARLNREQAEVGALEFGDTLEEMQNQELSPRMSAIRNLGGY